MKLTVICVFQNQKDHIEPTLTALYEAAGYPFQVVIIDDASGDQSRDVIHSLYDYYKHEHTFIFEHDTPHGRGLCLNEAAHFASGEVLWLVDRLDKVNVQVLAEQVDLLASSSECSLLMHNELLPDDIETWIELINNGRILPNEHFLWKWDAIPDKHRFFSPYQSDYHATEMAIRLAGKCGMKRGEPCFELRGSSGRMAGVSSNRAEILMSLFRERKLSVEQVDLLMSQLKLKEKKLTVDTATRSLQELVDEARAFLHEGYNIDALEIANKLLEKYPDTLEVLMLKVQVLNRLSRFVEAAELKHLLQRKYGQNLTIPKAGDRRPAEPRVIGEASDAPRPVFSPAEAPSPKVEETHARTRPLLTRPPDGSEPPAPPRHQAPPVIEPEVTQPAPQPEPPQPTEPAIVPAPAASTPPDLELDPFEEEFFQPKPLSKAVEREVRAPEPAAQEPVVAQPEEMEEEQVPVEEPEPEEAYEDEADDCGHTHDPAHVDDEPLFDEPRPAAPAPAVTEPPPAPKNAEKAPEPPPKRQRPLVSIVIPTASDRKQLLQNCLISLAEHSDPNQIEIIVVDNASLDDTFEYLEKLVGNEYFSLQVVTNHENKGFGYAANQGMELAKGKYICVMHNDVVIHEDVIGAMTDLMEDHPEVDMIGPVASRCDHPLQCPGGAPASETLVDTERLDSFCMFMKAQAKLRFDVAYGLAWFEDRDLCRQALAQGRHLAIAPGVYVEHFMGMTTEDFGVDNDSKSFWTNKGYFDQKWGQLPAPGRYIAEDPIQELVAIGTHINPWQPEPALVDRARQLLTSETRTRIHQATWDYDGLAGVMQLLMVLEMRELLRHLEDRLTAFEIQEKLCFRLVSYYYERSIYSRCSFYLAEIAEEKFTFRLKVVRLRIAVNEKKLNIAIPMLTELLHYSPSNPDLMRLAGELHRYDGNYEEAEHFYELARQTDPINYANLQL